MAARRQAMRWHTILPQADDIPVSLEQTRGCLRQLRRFVRTTSGNSGFGGVLFSRLRALSMRRDGSDLSALAR